MPLKDLEIGHVALGELHWFGTPTTSRYSVLGCWRKRECCYCRQGVRGKQTARKVLWEMKNKFKPWTLLKSGSGLTLVKLYVNCCHDKEQQNRTILDQGHFCRRTKKFLKSEEVRDLPEEQEEWEELWGVRGMLLLSAAPSFYRRTTVGFPPNSILLPVSPNSRPDLEFPHSLRRHTGICFVSVWRSQKWGWRDAVTEQIDWEVRRQLTD